VSESLALGAILKGTATWKSDIDRISLYGGISLHLPAHGEHHVWDTVGFTRTVITQHGDPRTVSDGGGMKVSEVSAVALCVCAGVKSLEWQLVSPVDSAPPVAAPNLAALFPFSVKFSFCCTARG
jgi:hypothetical protein